MRKPVAFAQAENRVARAGGIRTRDLLNPIQAFYQAELRPDLVQTIHQLLINRQRRAMKAILRTNPWASAILIGVLVGDVCVVRAEPRNGIELNENAFTFAAELIKEGRFIGDRKGAWSEHRPSAVEENEFIRVHGFGEYAKWHLGIDRRFPESSKRRYKFPYGDFKNIHRCALLAVKARARQYGYAEIESAATQLRAMIEATSDEQARH
jgi:hypothetical protein